uniref:CD24 molecule n=1 Tax=Equus caballus TaxID=9796 RepID=A0A3Q2L8S8_HORSE
SKYVARETEEPCPQEFQRGSEFWWSARSCCSLGRTWEQSRVGRASGAFRAGEGVNPQGRLSPPHPVRRPRQGGEPGTETQWFVVSGQQLPNSREAADPGCPTERTQPGEQETKTQSERLGEGAGAGPSTPIARSPGARRLRAPPTSLRRARGGRPRHLAKPGVPTKPAPFPFPWGGNLRIAEPREPPVPGPAQPAPQSGPWVEAARHTRGVDFSFAVLHAPSFQRYVSRADGVDMGRAMVARLGLGLLLLALLLPTQIYSNQTTVATTSSNSSQSTSAAPNPATATTHSNGGTLQSTASLFVISFSLLHLYC